MRGGVAQTLDTVHFGGIYQQLGKIHYPATVTGTNVGVYVLSQQGNLANTLFGEFNNLGDDLVKGSAEFLTAGIGHHAEGAVLATAFHDRDKGTRAVTARWHQGIELFYLGETDIHPWSAVAHQRVQHCRQAVVSLRSKHQIHIGGPAQYELALLTGHTATHPDHEFWPIIFPLAPTAQLGKNFLLRFFANRAGIEQQHVCLLRLISERHIM